MLSAADSEVAGARHGQALRYHLLEQCLRRSSRQGIFAAGAVAQPKLCMAGRAIDMRCARAIRMLHKLQFWCAYLWKAET